MSWNHRELMAIKHEFINRSLTKEESISKLCNEFKISRKTGYKWINRYKEDPIFGLYDHSKRPVVSPNRISADTVELIIKKRNLHRWGAKKLRQLLLNEGYLDLPCEKTFNRVLKRFDLIEPLESQKRKPFIRFEREHPNELWQMDFKGHFKLVEGRCHPLTILDDHSRFNICLKACLSEDEQSVRKALEEVFRTYGLPEAMTMDNGSPWKGSPPFRLSRLTVWLMRLGIKVGHSTPYHPQTQGKDERFHRSLKDEVLKYYQFNNIENAQLRFNEWREVYNNIRPHEGIGLKCPIDRYKPSTRVFPEKLPALIYPSQDIVRLVDKSGVVNFKGVKYFVGEHLYKEYVGLREVSEGIMDIYFSTTKVQRITLK